ncbi:MAG: dUTP diphosphatase [Synergistaceae bacterium]|jgi:dUTP pyrophosphatase|nr:dUTP diphosphatase [Synergistaceae bacterium]
MDTVRTGDPDNAQNVMGREIALTVKVKRGAGLSGIPLPSYATSGSAGVDLRASEAAVIASGEFATVGTGLSVEIPDGYEGQVRPRSGLAAHHGVTVLNSPGTIDSDYRGEIRVTLINHGKDAFAVSPGDRIAQMIFAPVTRAELAESADLSGSERAAGGFGSTGVK